MSEWESSGEAVKPEYFEHPSEGWLSFDPNTKAINPRRDGQPPINHPISLVGKFVGTRQPFIQTCSEPGPNNVGCPKFAGCPIGQKYPGSGPGMVIMRQHATVSMARCTDYFEVTRGGKATSQNHYGIDGWKLDTTRTTINVLGSIPVQNQFGQNVGVKKSVWQKEIPDLLPPWWPLMKEKGLPLPEQAKLYPELVDGPKPKKRGRPRKVSEAG